MPDLGKGLCRRPNCTYRISESTGIATVPEEIEGLSLRCGLFFSLILSRFLLSGRNCVFVFPRPTAPGATSLVCLAPRLPFYMKTKRFGQQTSNPGDRHWMVEWGHT